MSETRNIIFLHVPKAAGSTVQRMLRRKFGHRFLECQWSEADQQSKQLETFDAATHGTRVVCGHFGYGIHEALSGESEYLTILRQPAKRAHSFYRYAATTPGHYLRERLVRERMSFEEFLMSRMMVEIDNFQTRLFSGENGRVNEKPIGQLDAGDLEKAKRRLEEDFVFVGLSEDLDGTLLLWKQYFGWRSVFYQRINVTQGGLDGGDSLSAAVAAVHETQAMDLDLYETARRLFTASLTRYRGHYERDCATFRRWNEAYGVYAGLETSLLQYWRAGIGRLTGDGVN